MTLKNRLISGVALSVFTCVFSGFSLATNNGASGVDPNGYSQGRNGGSFDTNDRSGTYDNTDKSAPSDNYDKGTIPPPQFGGVSGDKNPNLAKEQFYTYAGIGADGNVKDVANAVATYKSYADSAADIKAYSETGASKAVKVLNDVPVVQAGFSYVSLVTDGANLATDVHNSWTNPNAVDIASGIGNAAKVGIDTVQCIGNTIVIVGVVTADPVAVVAGTAIVASVGTASLILNLAGTIGTIGGAMYADFVDNQGNHYVVPIKAPMQEDPQDRADRKNGDGNRPGSPRGGW
jgi:hypothetical protein